MSGRVSKLSSTFVWMTVARGRGAPRRHSPANLPPRADRLIGSSLRAKFIVFIASPQIAVFAAVTVVMEGHQRSAIIDPTRLRVLSIGASLTALSEGYLLSYNFIKLEQADVENRVKALR